MAELFADIFTWIEALPPLMAYGIIFIVAYGENVVPPIPGDMVIVFGGYLAGIGQLNFFIVWILSIAGGVLGFMSMYAVGRRVGMAVYDPNRFKWLRNGIWKKPVPGSAAGDTVWWPQIGS